MWLRNVENKKKKDLSFPPTWEFQTPISSSRAPDPFLLLRNPGLLINLPGDWLSHWEMVKDREARCATVRGIARNQTWPSNWTTTRASPVTQQVRNPPAMQEAQETLVRFLGWEDPLKKEMAAHSSIFAWEILWTEEPSGIQFMGLQRFGHKWESKHAHTPKDQLHSTRNSAQYSVTTYMGKESKTE